MKTKRNRIQIWLLCAAMLPAAMQAQFTYTTNNDGSLNIAGYTGSGGAVTIPDTINGLPVTSIGDSAFRYCTSLTSVLIPNSVTGIGVEGPLVSGSYSIRAPALRSLRPRHSGRPFYVPRASVFRFGKDAYE